VDCSFSGRPFTADIFGFDHFGGGFLFDLNPEGLYFYETLPREVMERLILTIPCLFMATGTVLATQPKAQKKHSISHKKTHVKSKPVSLREIASRYGDGPTFEGDPDAIRLSSLLFYGTPYRFGGNSSHALDCSAFVQKVFRANGIELPRDSRA